VIIDPEGEEPVYRQLASVLRARIVSGDLPAKRPLPSEMTLMQETGLSRGTVKHAARVLVEEGLVRTSPGRGHYVVPEDERRG
jgi:DNA-binding GntR family transcriptional regulator